MGPGSGVVCVRRGGKFGKGRFACLFVAAAVTDAVTCRLGENGTKRTAEVKKVQKKKLRVVLTCANLGAIEIQFYWFCEIS